MFGLGSATSEKTCCNFLTWELAEICHNLYAGGAGSTWSYVQAGRHAVGGGLAISPFCQPNSGMTPSFAAGLTARWADPIANALEQTRSDVHRMCDVLAEFDVTIFANLNRVQCAKRGMSRSSSSWA